MRSSPLAHPCNSISHYGLRGDLRGEVLRGRAEQQASGPDSSHPAGPALPTSALLSHRRQKSHFYFSHCYLGFLYCCTQPIRKASDGIPLNSLHPDKSHLFTKTYIGICKNKYFLTIILMINIKPHNTVDRQ